MSVAVPVTSPAGCAADAAAQLYERHSRRIFAFCLRRLRSPEEAEDAVQQTFLKAFGAMRGGFRPAVERAWLYRIAENVCSDRLRANGRRVRHEAAGSDGLLEVLPARNAQRIEGLGQALAELPATQRRALLLREWQGLSYREIAAELRVSQSAVETLLFRARKSLARRLEALSLIPWLKSALFGGGAKTVAAAVVTVGIGAAVVHQAADRLRRDDPAKPPAPVVAERRPAPAADAPASARERARQLPAGTTTDLRSSVPVPAAATIDPTASPSVAAPQRRPEDRAASAAPEPPAAITPSARAVPLVPPVDSPPLELPVPLEVVLPSPAEVVAPVAEALPDTQLPPLPTLP